MLRELSPRTRALAFVLVIVDSIFGVSLFSSAVVSELSGDVTEIAVLCVAGLILVTMVAITVVELIVERNEWRSTRLKSSSGTSSSAMLDALINSTLEMICRATSLPHAPDTAQVRAFIFRVEGDELVCRYYWALNPTSEKVGVTRFPLTEAAATRVAVVKCALSGDITRAEVDPLPAALDAKVKDDLTYVLSAPIRDEHQRVWGTVDFDTSGEVGSERLSTPLADAAIFQLARHLQVTLGLGVEQAQPAATG